MLKAILGLIMLSFIACQKEKSIVKHCIPFGYEGPLFIMAIPAGKEFPLSNDTAYVYYDSKGMCFTKYSESPRKHNASELFVYVLDGKDVQIIDKVDLYGWGSCGNSVLYSVSIISNSNPKRTHESVKPEVDSILRYFCTNY